MGLPDQPRRQRFIVKAQLLRMESVNPFHDFAHGHAVTELGGKKPHESNICRHIRLKQPQFTVVSQFYPEISPKNAAQCILNMAFAQQLLTIPHAHGAIVAFTQLAGGNTAGKVMTVGPNPKCNRLNGKLLDLYEKAIAKFPSLQEQMNRHIAYNEPFGDGFAANFDRD